MYRSLDLEVVVSSIIPRCCCPAPHRAMSKSSLPRPIHESCNCVPSTVQAIRRTTPEYEKFQRRGGDYRTSKTWSSTRDKM